MFRNYYFTTEEQNAILIKELAELYLVYGGEKTRELLNQLKNSNGNNNTNTNRINTI